MTRQNGDEKNIDKWTGMPFEIQDVPRDQPSAQGSPAEKRLRFDFGSLFWKFVASGSEAAPVPVLSALSTDELPYIRKRCAENLSTNSQALAMLADDKDESVRAAVANNRHTPLYILRKLSDDQSADVRFAIAANSEMPDAILLHLFMDPDPQVAERASRTLAA